MGRDPRALHTRGSRLRHFAPSENVQKTTVLQSSAFGMPASDVLARVLYEFGHQIELSLSHVVN